MAPAEPQPVTSHPGWVWWPGVNGALYARQPGAVPQVVVSARTRKTLLARIRAAEKRARQ